MVQGIVGSLLSSSFDAATKSPQFHEECWELCCSNNPRVAIAAPRAHAKTSGVTLGYGLSTLLFRERKFMLLVSDTEAQSSLFLGTFKQQLQDNQELIELFGLERDKEGKVIFIKDTETDIIVKFNDGHMFRIIAKGAEQKLRGLLWNGSRPDIILCHEEDTDIYTPETGWIKNQDFPGARKIQAHEAYKVTFDDGHIEVVSGDHRFLTKSGWKYIWEMTPEMEVVETLVLPSTTISQKLKNVWLHGIRRIVIESLLPAESGMSRIKQRMMRTLVAMLKKILRGKPLTVLNAEHTSSEPFLVG